MMLGGVGFQVGLDEARRKQQLEAQQAAAAAAVPAPAGAPDVVEQLKGLQKLREDGHLSAEEFRLAKDKVLGA